MIQVDISSHKERISLLRDKISQKTTKILVTLVLALFFIITITSASFESAIMDEQAHIAAGYSYVTQGEMRLNPEHPPLLKDISGLFLLPLSPNIPTDSIYWTNGINAQWDFGKEFLYKTGNDADKILFFSRLAPILLAVLFAFLLFKFSKELFGRKTALIALILFSFSPTIIAHSRYVTTDIAAAFGFFISFIYFIKFLKEPNKKNIFIAGIIFGTAQLFKFSLILQIPFLLLLSVLWSFTYFEKNNLKIFFKLLFKYIGLSFLVFLIGYVFVVWPIYKINILNYEKGPSKEQKELILSADSCNQSNIKNLGSSQFRDTACQLKDSKYKKLSELTVWMSDKSLLRPYAQYSLGALMVAERSSLGSTNYFLGKVSDKAHKSYFPILYILKEPLALHIMILISLVFLWSKISNYFNKGHRKNIEYKALNVQNYSKKYFNELSMLLFIIFYFVFSINSNLNIGIRHILPIYPFIFILLSLVISKWLSEMPSFEFSADPNIAKRLFSFYIKKAGRYLILIIMLLWYIISSVSVYPNFLTYFNELAGGPKNGSQYASDSNLDWGQSLKELAVFVEERNIKNIKLDYFGGGSPEYYLKEKYTQYNSNMGKAEGWFAISIYKLTLATGEPSDGYKIRDTDKYSWLNNLEPEAVIGNSIFVYYIK